MGDIVQFTPKKPYGGEIVTRDRSYEWGNIWGYLPDPDPILLKAGAGSEVLERCLADAHVLACYQSRKAGVINSEFKLVYPKGSEGLAEYFDNLVESLPVYEIIAQLLDAPFYGFSVNEVIWRERGSKWVPIEIAQKPNEWFVWDKLNRLRFLSRANYLEGELLPPYKFLVCRHFPSFQNPYGIRIMSRCIWPVTFKKGGFKFWTIFVERFGIPWSVGKVPPGTDEEARNALLRTIEKMVQSACAVINDDETIEIMEAKTKGDGGGSVFQALVDACNAEISKAILTQTLSTEIGDKGAYAATQSHLAVREELCQMDKRLVSGVFNQLFQWCALLNFKSAKAPRFVFVEEDDAREAHARRDSQLSNQGVRFKPSYYERQYNLRPGEFTVAEPKPQIAGGKPADEARQKDERLRDRQTLPNRKEK
ncbi:MAG: DUF935 domain-containing protein [Desulfobacteraceae bacterium]|nr:DUF935 domain-containing protein [Desulfobacteraceae bacterium]